MRIPAGLCLTCIALSARAQRQNQAAVELMTAQFERSYLSTSDIRGKDPRLIFEGNIAPPFFIVSPGNRMAAVLTPKVVLRMFALESAPVRTPSYMPRATVYFFERLDTAGARLLSTGSRPSEPPVVYYSLTVSHHSNGQEGPILNTDGTVNHMTGSFSTNFIELATAGRFLGRRSTQLPLIGYSRQSIEWHPPRWYDAESNKGYSHFRYNISANAVIPVDTSIDANCWKGIRSFNLRSCVRDWGYGYRVTYLAGNVAPDFQGRGRFPFSTDITITPTFSPDISIFFNLYTGQDYYNTYYTDYLQTLRIGIQANRSLGSLGAHGMVIGRP